MSGRAQAANLTGMLSQLANSVGEMGGAHDYLAGNIRDYAAPDVTDSSFESLSGYADWAQRNGKQEVADRYRALALTQQEKSKKGEYLQGMAQRQERVRSLEGAVGALGTKIQKMPDGSTVIVNVPQQRQPIAPADNGGFRRPPGTAVPESSAVYGSQQVEQTQPNSDKLAAQRRLGELQQQLRAEYDSMNEYGGANVQFGGTGTEGAVFQRALKQEAAEAAKASVAFQNSVATLNEKADAAAVREETPKWQQAEAGYQDRLGTLIGEIDELENIRMGLDPSDKRYDVATKLIDTRMTQKDSIAKQYQEAGVSSLIGNGTESDAFVRKEQDRITQLRREALTDQANQRIAKKAAAEVAGVAKAQELIAAGYEEIPQDIRVKMLPQSVAQAELTMETYRASNGRIREAFENAYVPQDDIEYAQDLGAGNTVIAAALKAYRGEVNNPTSRGILQSSAKKLQEVVEKHRTDSTDARESILMRQSVGEYARLFKSAESWTDSPFNDDVMDGITDENREEFYSSIEQVMVGKNINQITSPEQFFEVAVIARDKMGLNTDTANMAAVLDQVGTDQLIATSAENLYNESLAKIKSQFPKLNNSAQNRKARQMADKLAASFKILFMGQNTDQYHNLNQPYSKESPPWMHQLIDNDPETINNAIEWLREDENNVITFKNFEVLSTGDKPDA